MRIEIKKSLFGKYSVSYDCAQCGEGLTSPLEDAGKTDACPSCHSQFIVPGSEEVKRIRDEQDAAAKRAAVLAEKQKQAKLLERQYREQERAAQTEAEREKEQLAWAEAERQQELVRREVAEQRTQMRRCPFCAEEILAAAQKCKHCGEFLDGRSRVPTPVYVQQPTGQGGCSLIITIALGIVVGVILLALL